MKASICIATYDRPKILRRTLESIYLQRPTFDFEVIVVDDAGPRSAREVCGEFPVWYRRIERPPGRRGPAVARNMAYRVAHGEVLICQSDDVAHGPDAIARLVDELRAGEFVVATVWNVDESGHRVMPSGYEGRDPMLMQFTGPQNRRPLLFLGAVWRKDVYAVGGNDEEFVHPGWEDNWFAECLIRGRMVKPRYTSVEGFHLNHPRDSIDFSRSEALYRAKMRAGVFGNRPWNEGPYG